MSYTILSVAYPLTNVGPDASGGSEQIISLMDRHLTRAGCRSLVIAVQGSKVEGELIEAPRCSGILNDEVRRWGQRAHQRLILETLNRYSVDLVHMHSLDFHAYLPASSIPTLATLHLPVDWYPQEVFSRRRKNFHLNCVSKSQEDTCPASKILLPHVRNGIDVSSFRPNAAKQGFVLALGRICPEKGFHLALDAARMAGVPLVLAGELFPYQHHLSYFEKEIVPRLDSERRYIGPVGAIQKRKLLAVADAVLVPSLVAETSSLVTMEALASATPVIANRVGAIPELIEDGKNGFLVSTVEEMAQAIWRLRTINPQDCRQSAADRCDAFRMGQQYLAMYETMLSEAKVESTRPAYTKLSWLADVT